MAPNSPARRPADRRGRTGRPGVRGPREGSGSGSPGGRGRRRSRDEAPRDGGRSVRGNPARLLGDETRTAGEALPPDVRGGGGRGPAIPAAGPGDGAAGAPFVRKSARRYEPRTLVPLPFGDDTGSVSSFASDESASVGAGTGAAAHDSPGSPADSKNLQADGKSSR